MSRKSPTFNPKHLKTAERSVVLSVILFAAVMLVLGLTKEGVWQHFSSLSLPMWLALLGLSLINYVGRGIKWPLFAERVGIKMPWWQMSLYYIAGMAMTVTPGKLGTGLRLWLMNKSHGVSYSRSLPLMIIDPVVDLAALFLFTVAGALTFSAGHTAGIITFGAILLGCLLIFARPVLFRWLLKLIYHILGRRKPKIFAKMMRLFRRMTRLVTPLIFIKVVGLSLIGWGATIYAFDAILSYMGASLSYLAVAFVFSFSTILGGAAMTPGGLGGTEASMVILLMTLGVPAEIALAATVIIRTTTLWFGVLIGFSALPTAMKIATKKAA